MKAHHGGIWKGGGGVGGGGATRLAVEHNVGEDQLPVCLVQHKRLQYGEVLFINAGLGGIEFWLIPKLFF